MNASLPVRRVSRSEQKEIQGDLDRIVRLSRLGLLTETERRKALRRWVKHYRLILRPETRKRMRIGPGQSPYPVEAIQALNARERSRRGL